MFQFMLDQAGGLLQTAGIWSGTSSVSWAGAVIRAGAAGWQGTSAASFVGTVLVPAPVTWSGDSSLAWQPASINAAAAGWSGSSATGWVGTVLTPSTATWSGSSTTGWVGIGISTGKGTAQWTGTSTAAWQMVATARSAAAWTGDSSLAFASASNQPSSAMWAGDSSASFAGASPVTAAPATWTGDSSVSWVGAGGVPANLVVTPPLRATTRKRPGMPSYSRMASGDVWPSRFLALDVDNLGQVVQGYAGAQIYGISQAETRNWPPPNPAMLLTDMRAAAANEPLFIFGFPAEKVPICYGATVRIGDRLKSDQNGMAVPATAAGDECGAIAEEAGSAGYVGLCTMITPQRRR
jgi:hypothetical protein